MNRKKTILIAVMINVGLLAVLLIAALTTQEEMVLTPDMVVQESIQLPKFDEKPLFHEAPIAVHVEKVKEKEVPVVITEEPVIHQLPTLVEAPQIVPVQPAVKRGQGPVEPLKDVVVKKGDTLEKIAKLNHTSVEAIRQVNHMTSNFLKIGQVLHMPNGAVASSPKVKQVESSSAEYYTMKVGENPWAIAMKHHMKLDELLRLNSLNEEKARKLKPGDRLRIR